MHRYLALALLAVLIALPAAAQDRGQTRQNLRPLPEEVPPPDPLAAEQEIKDYRELMRTFVQDISRYARKQDSDFLVVARGGLELLRKVDPIDTTKSAPARTYLHSLDGVLVEGLHYGLDKVGRKTEAETREKMLDQLKPARNARLPVLTLDYADAPEAIDAALQAGAEEGFIPFVAEARGEDMTALPDYPKRPFRANPHSILTLGKARNFAAILNPAPFGRQDLYGMKMHDTNFDLFLTSPFLDRDPLSKRAVETLKYKKLGARRLVMAVIDVGTAASYKYYWEDGWGEGYPSWIKAPTPGNPDKHYVAYWQPGWQSVIYGNPESYVYGLIAQGYDGVVLGGLDSYRFFEGTLDQEDGFLF